MKHKFTFFYFFMIFFIFIFINYYFNITEGLTSQNNVLLTKGADAFCMNHKGESHILEQSCGNLTKHNCNSTSCCIWTSNKKCVAGNDTGATFNTNKDGKTIELDYYYYQNKCYGPKCASK